jgi:hypothetical protein
LRCAFLDKKIAKSSATTIKAFKPISMIARSNASLLYPLSYSQTQAEGT